MIDRNQQARWYFKNTDQSNLQIASTFSCTLKQGVWKI